MHVKYASRHVLYPVPNVFDCVVLSVIVARAVFFVFCGLELRRMAVLFCCVRRRLLLGVVRVVTDAGVAVRADTVF